MTITRRDLSGHNGKWKNNSRPHYPGLLDKIEHNYKKGQTVVLLYFHGNELLSSKKIKIDDVKFGVASTNAGVFRDGVHGSAWDFNEKHYDGRVSWYPFSLTRYNILPIKAYRQLLKDTQTVPTELMLK